ncbi:hypothetical protein H8356DRAFT_963644, partial [Neocallimastix lanati (nom. inval.)]
LLKILTFLLSRLINQYPITTWIDGLTKGYSYSYYLLWEPFINNLAEYISNDHPVVFMLFDSIDSSFRKSINESKCLVVTIPHPIKKYYQFKNSNCFIEAQQLACKVVIIYYWISNYH